MREVFRPMRLRGKTLALVEKANAVVRSNQAQGYTLTLRQLYYRLVASNVIENSVKSYKNLGAVISDARLAGLVDWDAIEDRTRNLRVFPTVASPGEAVRQAAERYLTDKWADQRYRVEVWVEKDALVGVLQKACAEVEVPFFSCRGYTSQTEMYWASKRALQHFEGGQDHHVIHLGDHDPSGRDMTRDVEDRLDMFLGEHAGAYSLRRIALNIGQVRRHKLPPNPAKPTDSRFEGYRAEFGESSWELDALEPATIHALILKEVLAHRDQELWDAAVKKQEAERAELEECAGSWDKVSKLLAKWKAAKAKRERGRGKK